MVVSALGAPATGQASSLQSALGGTFNGRNSSGLLYMHHGSLNSIAQTVPGGAATGGAMASQQSSIGNQAAAAMQTASLQAKPAQSHNAVKKMYQTQQNSR